MNRDDYFVVDTKRGREIYHRCVYEELVGNHLLKKNGIEKVIAESVSIEKARELIKKDN